MQELNRKKIWKKIMAGMLTMALIIGLLPNDMHSVEAAYTDATLNVGTSGMGPQDSNSRYLIYLDVEEIDENTLDPNAIWGNNTIYIDGKPVSSSNVTNDINYAIDSNQLLLLLYYSVFDATTATDVGKHTVMIPAGTIIGGTLKTTNDFGFIIDGDTVTEASVVTFTEVSKVAQDGDKRYLFVYDVTGTTVTDRFWNNNTVYLDGNAISTDANGAQSVNYAPASDSQIFFLLDYSYVETGKTTAESMEQVHTLTIPSGTAINDCILKNTLCYTLDKATITEAVPAVDVTVTPTNPHNAGATGFQFTTGSTSDSLPSDGNWTTNYYFASGGVTCKAAGATEEQTLDQVFLKKIAKDTYFLAFDAYVNSITFTSGDIVTIEAQVQSLGYRVQYAKTSFKYDGSTWAVYEETDETKSTLTFTNTNGGAWQTSETDGDRWLTYLASTEAVPASGTYIQSGLSISVDDGTNETTYPLNAGDLVVVEDKWALCLWENSYPAVPNQEETNGAYYIVTIQAGTGVDNHGDSWVISEDVDLLYCDESVQGVIAKEQTKMITVTGENLGGTGGIYFSTGTTNELPHGEGAWDKRPYIECGKITLDNVSLTPTANSLVKLFETRYYFSLNPQETSNVLDTILTDATLTLDFYASETQDCGKVFYFPKAVFVLTDAGWEREIVLGDANDDQNINVKDIVRLKKYLKDNTTVFFADGADANESGKTDKRDMATLYEFLIEGVRFTKGGENSQAVTGIPYYANDIDISLGAYHGPRAAGMTDYTYTSGGTISGITNETSYINATEFKRYADAGLNTLIHEADAVYASATAKIGAGVNNSDFQKYMQLAYEQGLDVYVTSQGLNSYLKPEGYGSTPVGSDFNGDGNLYDNGVADTATVDETAYGWDYNGNGILETSVELSEVFYYTDDITDCNADGNKKTILEADIEELLDFIVEKGYDNFKGFVMADEIYDAKYENYQKAVELIKKEGEERGLQLSVINSQLPSQAEGSKNSAGNYYIPTEGYESYITKFGTAAGNFIFDRYPLLKEQKYNGWSTKYTLDSGWLTNLKTVAEQGKANGFTTGVTIQSSGFEYGTNTGFFDTDTFKRDPESNADIQFQVYTALAYGMKSINYFTYWEHPSQSVEWFTSSMVQYGENGEVNQTAVYDYVKNANEEIKKFDHVFLDYDWQETLSASMASDTKGCVSSWSQTEDVIISRMYDEKKQLDGFWLVNASDPIDNTSKTVDVTFADATRALVFTDGEKQLVSLTNGKYESTLAAGEGQFVIPIK